MTVTAGVAVAVGRGTGTVLTGVTLGVGAGFGCGCWQAATSVMSAMIPRKMSPRVDCRRLTFVPPVLLAKQRIQW